MILGDNYAERKVFLEFLDNTGGTLISTYFLSISKLISCYPKVEKETLGNYMADILYIYIYIYIYIYKHWNDRLWWIWQYDSKYVEIWIKHLKPI